MTYDSTVVDTPINITFSFNNTDSSDGTRVRTGSVERVSASMFQGETVYRVLAPSDMARRPTCSSSFTSASQFVDKVKGGISGRGVIPVTLEIKRLALEDA